jgi:hypothetical protein
MRKVCAVTIIASVMWAALAGAQTPTAATFADRARLRTDATFVGRVDIATMIVALAVILEDPATPDHAKRMKLAAYVLREPEFVTRRVVAMMSAVIPATALDGAVEVTATDTQLQAIIATRWTLLATMFVPDP